MSKEIDQGDTSKRMELAKRLREAREYLGFSQEEVARYMGFPRTALTQIENGQRRVEAMELARLAKLYERPASYFMGEQPSAELLPQDVEHLARKASKLSKKDRDELTRFAEYLQQRARKE